MFPESIHDFSALLHIVLSVGDKRGQLGLGTEGGKTREKGKGGIRDWRGERERGEKKGVGFRNGEWSEGFGEEHLRKDLYPQGGREAKAC